MPVTNSMEFKLLRSTVDAYEGGIQEVLRLANNYCLDVWNLPLIFEVKEMDEAISLVDVAIPEIPKDQGKLLEEHVLELEKSSGLALCSSTSDPGNHLQG